MRDFVREWRARANTRETVLLVATVVLVVGGWIDTIEEAVVVAGPFASFIAGAQYRKSRASTADGIPPH